MSKWTLPEFYIPNPYDFQPIIRFSGVIPFGYEVDPEDEGVLLPIEKELIALERAKKLLKEYSLEEVADWISKETGRYISREGLRWRIKIEQKRKRQVSIAKFYADRYKEAAEKAAKLEARPGARDPTRDIYADPAYVPFKTCRA